MVYRHRRLAQGDIAQLLHTVLEKGQGTVAEHRQPRKGKAHRDQQYADNELTQGAATRDAGDKHADKRRPRDPPCPVEHCPAAEPAVAAGAAVGIEIEGFARQTGEIVAEVLHQRVQQMAGRPGEQHEKEHQQRQQHIQLRHAANALIHAADGGKRRGAHHHHNQNHLHGVALRDAGQKADAGVNLHHTNAKAGRQAEHGTDDAENIYRMANRPVNAIADQRIERRAQRQWQVMAIGEVGQRHRHQRIDAPAVQPPVHHRQHHAVARRLRRTRHPFRRLQQVIKRL